MDAKKFPKKAADLWKERSGGGDILAIAKAMQSNQEKQKRQKAARKKRGLSEDQTILKEE